MKRKYILLIATLLVLSLGVFITLSYAQDGSGLPDIPDVPEYVNGQKSVPILPKVPVYVDGILVDSHTFAEHYSMADLRFVVDPENPDVLYAFSTDEGLAEFMKAIQEKNSSDKSREILGGDPESPKANSYLFSGYSYGGSSKALPACGSKAWLTGFNDIASSCTSTPACNFLALYEHIFLGGRSLWLSGGQSVSNLGAYGFDNITSSTTHT